MSENCGGKFCRNAVLDQTIIETRKESVEPETGDLDTEELRKKTRRRDERTAELEK